MRPDEVYARVMITSDRHGLHHPRGRVLLTYQSADDETNKRFANMARLDMCDTSARIPLVSVLMEKKALAILIKSALNVYKQQGGDVADLHLDTVEGRPPLLENPLFKSHMAQYTEDDGDNNE
jgi:hypothetical protein